MVLDNDENVRDWGSMAMETYDIGFGVFLILICIARKMVDPSFTRRRGGNACLEIGGHYV
jgi:hypothetical protein